MNDAGFYYWSFTEHIFVERSAVFFFFYIKVTNNSRLLLIIQSLYKVFLFTQRIVIFSLLGGTSSILRTFLGETSEKNTLYFADDLEEEELLE